MTHVSGDVHVVQAPFSREQRNVAPAPALVQLAVFVALLVGFAGTVVSTGAGGATVSTTQPYAVEMLSAPEPPVRPRRVCRPGGGRGWGTGPAHAVKEDP